MLPLDARILVLGHDSIAHRYIANLMLLGYHHLYVVESPLPANNPAISLIKKIHPNESYHQKYFDLVIISSDDNTPFDLIISLLQHGSPCLIEAGYMINQSQAELLKEHALLSKASVSFAYSLRYHPLLQRFANNLDKKNLGKPLSIEARQRFLGQGHAKQLYKLVVENLDLLHHLFEGRKPLRISTIINDFTAGAVCQWPDDSVATLHISETLLEPQHSLSLYTPTEAREIDLLHNKLTIWRNVGSQVFKSDKMDRNSMYMQSLMHFLENYQSYKPIDTVKAIDHYARLMAEIETRFAL